MTKSYSNFKTTAKEECNAAQRFGGFVFFKNFLKTVSEFFYFFFGFRATIYDERDCDTVELELGVEQHKQKIHTTGGENSILTGGWHEVDPSSAVAKTVGQFAAQDLKGRINTILSKCEVESVMSQVVAGVNYKIVYVNPKLVFFGLWSFVVLIKAWMSRHE